MRQAEDGGKKYGGMEVDAIDEDEEGEDDEFGVRDTVKQFHPREPSKEERERSKRSRTCRLATGAGTASECEASRKREEVAEVHCSLEMKGQDGGGGEGGKQRWRCRLWHRGRAAGKGWEETSWRS